VLLLFVGDITPSQSGSSVGVVVGVVVALVVVAVIVVAVVIVLFIRRRRRRLVKTRRIKSFLFSFYTEHRIDSIVYKGALL